MKNEKYDVIAKTLHWLSAVVILWATLSGFYLLLPNIEEHIKRDITELNISITTLFIPIFCFRILYRLTKKAPSHSALLSNVEIKMAQLMHNMLYVFTFTVLLSGTLMMDSPISIFNVFEFPQILDDSNSITFFKSLHGYSTQLLGVLVLMHIFALIKHEITGNRILKRMI